MNKTELHNEIMRLPCAVPYSSPSTKTQEIANLAFIEGHKTARHAAAELVASVQVVPAEPSELVTLESAMAAIEHLSQSNSRGRDRDAEAMLVAASPLVQAPQPLTALEVATLAAKHNISSNSRGIRAHGDLMDFVAAIRAAAPSLESSK